MLLLLLQRCCPGPRGAGSQSRGRVGMFSKRQPPPPPPTGGPVLDFGLVDWRVLGLCFGTHLIVSSVLKLLLARRQINGDDVSFVIAFNTVAIVYAVYCTNIGMSAWFGGEAAALNVNAQTRLYGESEGMQKICVATAAYELYNTVACLVSRNPQYRATENIIHHIVTWFLSLFASYPFLNYCA